MPRAVGSIGSDDDGRPVYLRDLWPSQAEIDEIVAASVKTDAFTTEYGAVFEGSDEWRAIPSIDDALYPWDPDSTYVQEPPFFQGLTQEVAPIAGIDGAKVLLKLGDSVTTDHISPAGAIALDSPAGRYLTDHGVERAMFNSYGSRRGNDRVMTRGTFANIRIRNHLAPGTEGGYTTDFTDGEVRTVYEASLNYREAGVPLVVLAGKDYGMGSSRDWAAKGTFELGVKAVIAESFERIHRSNLVMMGVVPLTYLEGESAASLGLDGTETFSIDIDDDLQPRQLVRVTATDLDGATTEFMAMCRCDTEVEVEYLRHGGILHMVIRRMSSE